MTNVTGSTPSVTDELRAYEVGAKVYDQLIAVHSNIATVANVYLLVTGVLWSAVATDTLRLPPYAAAAILVFHLIGSVAALQTLASSLNAIGLRHHFLPAFGEKYYPTIEGMGKTSFNAVYGAHDSLKARFARWGRQRLLWYVMPAGGFVGSVYFLFRVLSVPVVSGAQSTFYSAC